MALYGTSVFILSVYKVVLEIIDFTMRVFQEEAHCSWDDLNSTTSSHCWVNLKGRGGTDHNYFCYAFHINLCT